MPQLTPSMAGEAVYRSALEQASAYAQTYLETINDRHTGVPRAALAAMQSLGDDLADEGQPAESVLQQLHKAGSPATTAIMGGRFYGGVIGGSLPAALGARWLADAWDQNACLFELSPVTAYLEDVALGWVKSVLGLPKEAAGALVTGTQMADVTALAAARESLLRRAGWDVESDGLFGAPPIEVVVGEEVHATMLKALGLLGLGRKRVRVVPVDGQGRMVASKIPKLTGPAIVCVQLGNVNTGACDPVEEICDIARGMGAWVHVDGAFGIWAAAAEGRRHLVQGMERADSWATDAHKWLNVPQDCGIAVVREAEALRRAMAIGAAYLGESEHREPMQWCPESSRRARGVEVWAALRSLGRRGVGELVERCCRHAARFATGIRTGGYEVLNDVVLNQVLVSFGDDARTARVIAAVQADGTCWCGGTFWQGRKAMRISVSSWATTAEDVDRSLRAILRLADAS